MNALCDEHPVPLCKQILPEALKIFLWGKNSHWLYVCPIYKDNGQKI